MAETTDVLQHTLTVGGRHGKGPFEGKALRHGDVVRGEVGRRSEMLEQAREQILRQCGTNASYFGSKVLWWKNEFPDLYRRCEKFVFLGGYVAGKMAGLAAEAPGVDQFLRRYEVRVEWIEGALPETIRRTTYGFDWEGARALWERSLTYRQVRNAAYNIGEVHLGYGRRDLAFHFYGMYLDSLPAIADDPGVRSALEAIENAPSDIRTQETRDRLASRFSQAVTAALEGRGGPTATPTEGEQQPQQ